MRIAKKWSFSKERGFTHWGRASWAVWGRVGAGSISQKKRDSFALCLPACAVRCAMLTSDALH